LLELDESGSRFNLISSVTGPRIRSRTAELSGKSRSMCVSDLNRKTLNSGFCLCHQLSKRYKLHFAAAFGAAVLVFCTLVDQSQAQLPASALTADEVATNSAGSQWTPTHFDSDLPSRPTSTVKFLRASNVSENRKADTAVAPAEFDPSTTEESPQLPSYLNPAEDMPQPALLDGQNPDQSILNQLDQLARRMDEMDKNRIAQEDATRAIIRKSFAERASNITDTVTFGGALETLTFWQSNFDNTTESDIRLDTAELDFDIQMNTWSHASLYVEYNQGDDFLFPTNEGDVVGVDRFTVRRGIITIGNVEKYPVYITTGRDFIPFGISTGDPVADVLTIVDPLTVEVFETQEDILMFGFELPTPPPPAPVSPYARPPVAPRPILFNPLAREVVRKVCPYCGPLDRPNTAVATPYTCVAPWVGAIYFYNGDTLEGINDSNHIEHMGGTLGYRSKGTLGSSDIPWTAQCNVDVNSSVFDSNFLQFEYRHFLDQIGFVPGMAAHLRSSLGPFGFIVEWNGAISDALFTDDAANIITIRPSAWQVSLNYQFDWNPTVEVIGAQGTYLAFGYSESQDLFGVTRIVDPLAPVPERVGNVPERRVSIGLGEWVLEGMRVAFEYSHAIDYGIADGGTGNSADAVLMQWTYEW
jgi:hypothetical protein